jgi:GNAT superfamily N-acetyltransferase
MNVITWNRLDLIYLLEPITLEWEKTSNGEEWNVDTVSEDTIQELYRLVAGQRTDLLVLMDHNVPKGFIGMVQLESPVSQQKFANEHFWYVMEEARGIGSMRLVKHAEAWAKEKGCSHLIMTASTLASDLHDRICRLYVRRGMDKFETSYIKEVT